MTIHIYYRHTPTRNLTPQRRPSWFGYEICFANLIHEVEPGLRDGSIVLNIVFDGVPEDLEKDAIAPRLFGRNGSGVPVVPGTKLHFIKGGNQRAAWRKCLAIIGNGDGIGDDDLIYFLENDYLHVPGWIDKLLELKRSVIPWQYATLYDHPDKYPGYTDVSDSARYRGLTSQLYCAGSHHWRSTPSSCATYILSGRTFRRDRNILRLGLYDYKLFMLLGRVRRRRLVSPVPSLATHSMSDYLAPTIAWEEVARATS